MRVRRTRKRMLGANMHVQYHTLIPTTKAVNCLAAESACEDEEEFAFTAVVFFPTCLRAQTSLMLTARMQMKGRRKKRRMTMYRVYTTPNNVSARSLSHSCAVLKPKTRSTTKGELKATPTVRMTAALFRVKPTPHTFLARKGLSMERHRSTLMSTMV